MTASHAKTDRASADSNTADNKGAGDDKDAPAFLADPSAEPTGRPGSDALPEKSAFNVNDDANDSDRLDHDEAATFLADPSAEPTGRPGSDALPEKSAFNVNGPSKKPATKKRK